MGLLRLLLLTGGLLAPTRVAASRDQPDQLEGEEEINKAAGAWKLGSGAASTSSGTSTSLPSVDKCEPGGRERQTVVSDLDGTLLRSASSFPYFMLIAFEAGSPLRAVVLLLVSPVAWLLYHLVSEAAGIKILIFFSYAGLKASQIQNVARAVLTKFYLEDMHSRAYRVFVACGKRYVVTANPRIMVEPFLREYLEVDGVLGTEIEVTAGGYATGFVSSSGVLVGSKKRHAVQHMFNGVAPDVGLGDRKSDIPFLSLCKEAYLVPRNEKVDAVPRHEFIKPLVFHDGRLVQRPTPLMSLLIIMWAPFGLVLAILRMSIGISIPMWWALPVETAMGVRIRIKGKPPASGVAEGRSGVLFVCSHRTLLDPIFLSIALRRNVTAVTYSISRVSEVLSPIKTVRLTRCRDTDAKMMAKLLEEGDLVVCPEGTTCREPFLLRFSSLFAELADSIVPVTMSCQFSMFHGTSARGMKGMDPFFFFMNPSPLYEVTFLEQLPMEMTCAAGKSSHEVANHVQRALAASLGFQCTNLTRRDKYRILVGNDGRVPEKQVKKITGC